MQSAYGLRTDNGEDRLHYGCFMSGGDGNLLGAQLIEVIWIAGAPPWLCLLTAGTHLHVACMRRPELAGTRVHASLSVCLHCCR